MSRLIMARLTLSPPTASQVMTSDSKDTIAEAKNFNTSLRRWIWACCRRFAADGVAAPPTVGRRRSWSAFFSMALQAAMVHIAAWLAMQFGDFDRLDCLGLGRGPLVAAAAWHATVARRRQSSRSTTGVLRPLPLGTAGGIFSDGARERGGSGMEQTVERQTFQTSWWVLCVDQKRV